MAFTAQRALILYAGILTGAVVAFLLSAASASGHRKIDVPRSNHIERVRQGSEGNGHERESLEIEGGTLGSLLVRNVREHEGHAGETQGHVDVEDPAP